MSVGHVRTERPYSFFFSSSSLTREDIFLNTRGWREVNIHLCSLKRIEKFISNSGEELFFASPLKGKSSKNSNECTNANIETWCVGND